MKKVKAILLCGAVILAFVSCRMINQLTSDKDLKKVGDLWSDVPRMDDLQSSEADMPMYVKLLMRTALNNLYRLNNDNEDRTKSSGDWAVFSTTKTPEDVQNFYTNDRMTSFGNWQPDKNPSCLNGKEHGFSGVACVFAKTVNNRDIGLLIVAAQEEQKKRTNIFFVRVETDKESAVKKPANTSRP